MLIRAIPAFNQFEGRRSALPLFRCADRLLFGGGLLGCALILAGCTNAEQSPLPVQVGGYVEYDACLAVGKAVSSPAGFSVRTRPETSAPVVATLTEGQFVWMCDSTDDQAWTGILLSHREDGRIACGVSGTIAERRDYTGPCLQGWVPREVVILYAE